MSFIPHTPDDEALMLKSLGLKHITELFVDIKSVTQSEWDVLPQGLSELEITRLMQQRQPSVKTGGCFLGAGAYEHFIPAAIWQIVSRAEFYTAYTPYQAEASQGSLQLIYEFQTMMASLTGMEVANASLYDGATALSEAILMSMRLQKNHKINRFLIPVTIHPRYRAVLKTIVATGQAGKQVEFIELPFNKDSGGIKMGDLPKRIEDLTAVIIPQPNFFGVLEETGALTDFAHEHGALAIAVVNPIALALLKPPGQWGQKGADIVCGEGQPLGVPLSCGGPYFGFMSTRKQFIRQLPGRIVGRTEDQQGRTGFVLTLQAREQHIRRGKATSNICTNQGLLITAATIYLSLLGPIGLRQVMTACLKRTERLKQLLREIKGLEFMFNGPHLHEFVIRLPKPVQPVISLLASQSIQMGYDLSQDYRDLKNCILVCVTETKTEEDLQCYQQALAKALS